MQNNNILGTFIVSILVILFTAGIGGRIIQHTESFASTINQQIDTMNPSNANSDATTNMINKQLDELEKTYGRL